MTNPLHEKASKQKLITTIAILAYTMVNVFRSATNSTLLPIAALEIGGTEWYTIANAIGGILALLFMPLGGWLGAKNPRYKITIVWATCFLAVGGTIVGFMAQSMYYMIVASILFSATSPGIYICGYALIRDMYDAKKAGYFLGLCATMTMLGMLIGPMIGGFVIDNLGWRYGYLWMAPCFIACGLAVILGGVKLSKDEAEQYLKATGSNGNGGKFDVVGTIGLLLFLGGLMLFLSLGTSLIPFGTTWSYILLVIMVVGGIMLFTMIKKKGNDAVLPAPALKDRNTLLISINNALANMSSIVISIFIPMYILYVMGGTAVQSSLATALYSIIGIPLGPIFGKWVGKSGSSKGVTVVGGIARMISMAGFALLLTPESPLMVIYVLVLIAGVFNCQAGITASTGGQIMVPEKIRLASSSIINNMTTIWASVGVAIITLLMGIYGIDGGFKICAWASVVCGALIVVTGLMFRHPSTFKAEQNN